MYNIPEERRQHLIYSSTDFSYTGGGRLRVNYAHNQWN